MSERDWNSYHDRFVRDPLPIRLGGIAANLARIHSFSDHNGHCQVVKDMLEDSKFLIEWVAPAAELDTQVELLVLQRMLARWFFTWEPIWNDRVRKQAVASEAARWSERILDLSGLLNDETYNQYNIPRR